MLEGSQLEVKRVVLVSAGVNRLLLASLLLAAACAGGNEAEESNAEPSPSRVSPSAPPPEESRPLRRGFTQRPPPGTEGLPPPIEPLLTEQEIESLARSRSPAGEEAGEEQRAQAQQALRDGIEAYEAQGPSLSAVEREELLGRLRAQAVGLAREGKVSYFRAEDLYEEYIFPRDPSAADAAYGGKVVLLTGTVAPHSMLDLADGFKLFEQTPYVHDPLLLATEHELNFVRCALARKELQKLRDWQEVHLVGMVVGKDRGDLLLRRCIVM